MRRLWFWLTGRRTCQECGRRPAHRLFAVCHACAFDILTRPDPALMSDEMIEELVAYMKAGE